MDNAYESFVTLRAISTVNITFIIFEIKVIIKFNVSDIIVLSIRDLAFDLIVVDCEGGFEIESCCMIGDLFIKCVILILLAYNNNCFSFLIKLAYLD